MKKLIIIIGLAMALAVVPVTALAAVTLEDIAAVPITGETERAMGNVLVVQVNTLNGGNPEGFMATYHREGQIETQGWSWLSWYELNEKMSSAISNIEGFTVSNLKVMYNVDMGIAVATYNKKFNTPYGVSGGQYKAQFKKNKEGQWVIFREEITD